MKLLLHILALALLATGAFAAAQQKPEDLAQHSADAWLALVDSGQYAASWNDAAEVFKSHITKGHWEASAKAARVPLGQLKSRKLEGATFKTSIPGAPDGQYVILQYASVFEHKQSAIETVTPMLDKDGKWHVSGYYIR